MTKKNSLSVEEQNKSPIYLKWQRQNASSDL